MVKHRSWKKALILALALTLGPAACLAEESPDLSVFASKLCRSGGGAWNYAVPVVVTNRTDEAQVDRLVAIPIVGAKKTTSPSLLPLTNELAQSVRVCDPNGVEYMFNIVDPSGKFVDKGNVPENSVLTFPAAVPANSSATYYVFFNNDAAYPNMDRLNNMLKRASNLDFEEGQEFPNGWKFDRSDSIGSLTWSDENPYSGKKCVRCEVPEGAKPSWIAARQFGVSVKPGAKYRLEGYVKGENINGTIGWYAHLGNSTNEMIGHQMVSPSSEKNFDWTKASVEFTVPDKADLISFGTVLYGTGTAWFDAVSLTRLDDSGAPVAEEKLASEDYEVKDVETLPANGEEHIHAPEELIDLEYDFHAWDPDRYAPECRYAQIRVDNVPESGKRTVRLDLAAFENHWGKTLTAADFDLIDESGKPVAIQFFDGAAFCELNLNANATDYFFVVELENASAERQAKNSPASVKNQAFPGTMMQSTNAENASDPETSESGASLALPQFIIDRNILDDGDFENVDPETFKESPAPKDGVGWHVGTPEEHVKYSIVDPGVKELGSRSLRVEVEEEAPLNWRGWRRSVAVTPGQNYCFGYAIKTDSKAGSYDMHLHWRKKNGELSSAGMSSIGKPVSGKTDWTFKCGMSKASDDTDLLELHLTNMTHGASQYDSVFLVPIDVAEPVGFFGGKQGVFQVPAVVKVFRDTTFASNEQEISASNPAKCLVARGEEEAIQIAVRGIEPGKVTASRPKLRGSDAVLAKPEIFAVGNVLVDYPSNYYSITLKSETIRKFPSSTKGCDGWVGYWPDPLIPIELDSNGKVNEAPKHDASESYFLSISGQLGEWALDQENANALWIRFRVPKDAKPGVYEGTVAVGKDVVIPYEVEVLNFVAPETKLTGIYDARISADYWEEGTRQEKLNKVAEKLLDRKLSPDQPVANPSFKYNADKGTYDVDWTEYDAQCARFFDELGGKAAYFPNEFYLFGWGVPPKVVNGENPYPGEWPYDGADRALLRPEYKRAYQEKLRLFWEHIKAKGWADKMVLYISDEPFYSKPEIIAQMKALCDMIHEVDPEIPIYSSTWVLVPEWLNYINVWGIGHYGGVGEEGLKKIHDAGGRIWWTTDGQMCLDTPLCATERLLPYACVARGAELYEFWGASWYTCDPFESASHLYIPQSDQPGVHYFVRYPNGDGYIFYPGDLIARPGEIIESIRSVQATEGIEDAGWLVGLQQAIEKLEPGSKERNHAEIVLNRALNYLPLTCGSGRYSTRYMPDPKEFEQIRNAVGRELEALSK